MQDAPVLALLARITFAETFGHYFSYPMDVLNYLDLTFGVAKIRRGIQKENNEFWIALYDGLPVGYAKLKLNSVPDTMTIPHAAQLQKIYVLKDFLSKKIGLKLQDSLFAEAQARNYQTLWLSVLKENARAIRFYEKSGYQPIGEHDFQIGKENFSFFIMSKSLYGG